MNGGVNYSVTSSIVTFGVSNSNVNMKVKTPFTNYSLDTGIGLGVGLGEFQFGYTRSDGDTYSWQRVVVRPGGGAAIATACVFGIVATDGMLSPILMPVLKSVF
jgi:hypothetical protein